MKNFENCLKHVDNDEYIKEEILSLLSEAKSMIS